MEEQRGEAAQRGHLGERQIDEDHFSRDHVETQIRQHGHQDHAGDEWRQHQLQAAHGTSFAPKALESSLTQRFIRSKYVFTPAWPPVLDGTITALAPVRCATSMT